MKLANEMSDLSGTVRSFMTPCDQEATERSRSGTGDELPDVMLWPMAKRITCFQTAEILGISCRQMQCWKMRCEHKVNGLFDRRRGIPSPKRVPLETVEEVLRL